MALALATALQSKRYWNLAGSALCSTSLFLVFLWFEYLGNSEDLREAHNQIAMQNPLCWVILTGVAFLLIQQGKL